jgi:ABC-type uncharacterized transport system permease subunit
MFAHSEMLNILAALTYTLLAFLAMRTLASHMQSNAMTAGRHSASAKRSPPYFALTAIAMLLHSIALAGQVSQTGTMHFGFATAISAMLLLAVLLFTLESILAPVGLVAIALFPAAGIACLLSIAYPGKALTLLATPPFVLHLSLAVASYSVLTIAAAHACLMQVSEKLVRRNTQNEKINAVLMQLPPLLVMERMLFRLIGVGFALLTLTVLTGIAFHEQIFGKAWKFDHKTVFSIASWLIFGAVLLGRWRNGWRGKMALNYTLAGFALLVLAYIGTQFVLEVLLGR